MGSAPMGSLRISISISTVDNNKNDNDNNKHDDNSDDNNTKPRRVFGLELMSRKGDGWGQH